MTQEALKRLRADANEGLDVLKRDQSIRGAINWADLKCEQACFVQADDGKEWWMVVISEAHPEAVALQGWMRDWLARKDWVHVDVRTEW